jgi:hypothetical protein
LRIATIRTEVELHSLRAVEQSCGLHAAFGRSPDARLGRP